MNTKAEQPSSLNDKKTNALVLFERRPFTKGEDIIIVGLISAFLILFIYLLSLGESLFAYWVLTAVFALSFMGFSAAIVRHHGWAVGGGAAVFVILIWITTNTFKAYDSSAQKIFELRRQIVELQRRRRRSGTEYFGQVL